MKLTVTFRRLDKPHIAHRDGVWVWYWHKNYYLSAEARFLLDAFVGRLNSGS